WGVVADVWSVTSWTKLRREAMACDEERFLHPEKEQRTPWVTEALSTSLGPVVAVSDYMKQVQDQIRGWVPEEFSALGADGFGFSDTRPAARRYFHIDGPSVAVRALQMLADRGWVAEDVPAKAAEKYQLLDASAGTSGTAGGDARGGRPRGGGGAEQRGGGGCPRRRPHPGRGGPAPAGNAG